MSGPTAFQIERIARLLRRGNYRKTASVLAGIPYPTFNSWLQKGELEPEGNCGKFKAAVELAEAQCESILVGRLRKGTKGNGALALQMLKSRSSENWGDKAKIHVEGKLEVDHGLLSDFDSRLARLNATSGPSLPAREIEVTVIDRGSEEDPSPLAPLGQGEAVSAD